MKKFTYIMVMLLLFSFMLSGCGTQGKITEIENEIAELEEQISSKEEELKEWQAIYDEAHDVYYAEHSDNAAIQSELERTKEYMDEAQKKINDINRAIGLYELNLEMKQEELDKLKE